VGLTAQPCVSQVALSWAPVASATNYNVKVSTTSGSGYVHVAYTSDFGYVDTGLSNGTTYYFVVSARNLAGEGANSSEASATPFDAPPAPTELAASPGSYVVSLSWHASAGATSYTIYRATASGGSYAATLPAVPALDETEGTTITSDDPSVYNGVTYYFKVQATDACGESSDYSNTAYTTPVLAVPDTPANLKAAAGDGGVALSWGFSNNADTYTVSRSTVTGGPYDDVASTADRTYTNTGLTNGVTYFYVVKALNGAGTSSASNEASATPAATTLTADEAIEIARTFCAAIGSSQTGDASAQYPSPTQYSQLDDNFWLPRWLVKFGDPAVAEVEVVDSTSVIASYYNFGLSHSLMDGGLPAGTPITESAALTAAATVLSASNQTDSLGDPTADYIQLDNPATEFGQFWRITYPRLYSGVPFHNQTANVLLQGDTGAVRSFGLSFPWSPPASMAGDVTSSQATTTAAAQLTSAGITGFVLDSVQQEIVMPSTFWQDGGGTPQGSASMLAWTCYYEVDDDSENPMYFLEVDVDIASGNVIGGGVGGNGSLGERHNAMSKTTAKKNYRPPDRHAKLPRVLNANKKMTDKHGNNKKGSRHNANNK
jgi:fibronectin type 3 domain-containing protein